jgi:hypothetical protein
LRFRLGGEEDPVDPEVRKPLNHCRTELADTLSSLGADAEEATEDCEEELKMMRGFIARNS